MNYKNVSNNKKDNEIIIDNEIVLKDEWIISISHKSDVDIIYTYKNTYVVKKNSQVRINSDLVKFTLADKK